MIAALLLAALVQAEPRAVDSRIDAVAVYSSGALVRRVASVPASGTVVLRGLPATLDRDAVRVRCDGALVAGVEARERVETAAPEPRAVEAAARVRELEQRLAAEQDEEEVVAALARRVDALFALEERAHDAARGERLDWLTERLGALAERRRAAAARSAATQRELADARAELGALDAGGGRPVVDLVVDLEGRGEGPATLAAEYLVPDASWTPLYDLRAPRTLERVELTYRASIRQTTGEDWTDAEIALSTATPRRGVTAPEPPQVWLSLDSGHRYKGPPQAEAGLAFDSDEDLAGRAAALVVDQGLSLRYVLPRRETVESRPEPTAVLVGRADLQVAPEHVVVPARDVTVWLRALATNTSPWVLVPGRASVFFGADFLGHAGVDLVQRGEELVLHLGPDPGLEVERVVLQEVTDEAGLFSARDAWRLGVRIRVVNRGAFGGAATVIVQEAVPRSADERVKVELDARPAPATGTRFDELRETQGVAAWVLSVPRGQERTVEATVEITYPEGLELRRW